MATAEPVVDVYGELRDLVSSRTVEILEQRDGSPPFRRRGWLVRRALLAADVAGLSVAFLVSELAYGLSRFSGDFNLLLEGVLFLAALPVWIVAAKLYGLYERDEERTDHTTADDVRGVVHMVTIGAWAVLAFAWLTSLAHPQLSKLVLFWFLAVIAVSSSRAAARALCRRHVLYIQNTVILGSGPVGQRVAQKFRNHPEYGINIVGFVDTEPQPLLPGLETVAYLGAPERLDTLVPLLDVERVIVAFPELTEEETLDLMRMLGRADVQVDIVPRLYDLVSPRLEIHSVEGLPLIGLPPPRLSRSSLLVKRAFDVTVAGALLVLLAPLLPLVAWRIRRGSTGPVLFRQMRMGADDRPFEILKFRTMVADAESRKVELAHLNHYVNGNGNNGGGPMFKIHDDPRVTRFGRVLRRYFFDEIPQLVNVFRGQMSLVGPRPLVLDEDRHVDEWGRRRLALKPGMTGIWQVLGRNDIGFEEMVRLDYQYVTQWSLWQDFRIIFRTLPIVAKGGGGTL
jgi:exopolysaccharide biosynthesis polyprenyl glycosylphosphotransferase